MHIFSVTFHQPFFFIPFPATLLSFCSSFPLSFRHFLLRVEVEVQFRHGEIGAFGKVRASQQNEGTARGELTSGLDALSLFAKAQSRVVGLQPLQRRALRSDHKSRTWVCWSGMVKRHASATLQSEWLHRDRHKRPKGLHLGIGATEAMLHIVLAEWLARLHRQPPRKSFGGKRTKDSHHWLCWSTTRWTHWRCDEAEVHCRRCSIWSNSSEGGFQHAPKRLLP